MLFVSVLKGCPSVPFQDQILLHAPSNLIFYVSVIRYRAEIRALTILNPTELSRIKFFLQEVAGCGHPKSLFSCSNVVACSMPLTAAEYDYHVPLSLVAAGATSAVQEWKYGLWGAVSMQLRSTSAHMPINTFMIHVSAVDSKVGIIRPVREDPPGVWRIV